MEQLPRGAEQAVAGGERAFRWNQTILLMHFKSPCLSFLSILVYTIEHILFFFMFAPFHFHHYFIQDNQSVICFPSSSEHSAGMLFINTESLWE